MQNLTDHKQTKQAMQLVHSLLKMTVPGCSPCTAKPQVVQAQGPKHHTTYNALTVDDDSAWLQPLHRNAPHALQNLTDHKHTEMQCNQWIHY
jgi:hypothetical protein